MARQVRGAAAFSSDGTRGTGEGAEAFSSGGVALLHFLILELHLLHLALPGGEFLAQPLQPRRLVRQEDAFHIAHQVFRDLQVAKVDAVDMVVAVSTGLNELERSVGSALSARPAL